MNTQPIVSICLPVYNGERYLAQAIESVLSQTYGNFELLIADDLSTDGSPAIIASFSAMDKRIKAWRNPERNGLFANYNECISKASGKYIKPFAQDDLLEPEALELLVQTLEENPDVTLVSSAKRLIGSDGESLQDFRQFPDDRIIAGRDVIVFNLIQLTNWVGEPATTMFRSEFIGEGFDTCFHHYGDIEYWFRIVKDHNYAFLSKTLCSFRRHPDSATNKNLTGMLGILDALRLWELYKPVLAELGEPEALSAKRMIEIFARQMDHLVRMENLNIQTILREPLPSTEAKRVHANQFTDPREELFWILRMTTQRISEMNDLETGSAADRQNLQAQINNLRTSSSWKLTSPLRFSSKLSRHTTATTARLRKPAPENRANSSLDYIRQANAATGFEKAIVYARNYLTEKQTELFKTQNNWFLEYHMLQQELATLKSSFSWKVSRPLRKFSKRLGGR